MDSTSHLFLLKFSIFLQAKNMVIPYMPICCFHQSTGQSMITNAFICCLATFLYFDLIVGYDFKAFSLN